MGGAGDWHYLALQAVRDLGWLWAVAVVVLAVVGIYQARTAATLSTSITEDQYMNPGVNRGDPAGTASA